jgi:hypothetical protein
MQSRACHQLEASMTDAGIDPGIAPSGDGCVDCDAQDGWWLHLRRCALCGNIGCCDTSPSQHGTPGHQGIPSSRVLNQPKTGSGTSMPTRTRTMLCWRLRHTIRWLNLFPDPPGGCHPIGKTTCTNRSCAAEPNRGSGGASNRRSR